MKGLKFIVSLANLQMFVYNYALIKGKIKFSKRFIPRDFLVNFISLICGIISTLLNYLWITGFAIYYEIVNLILMVKHGKDFVGIMEGSDMVFTVEDKTGSIINSIFMLELPQNEDFNDIRNFFAKSFGELCKTHVKLGCVRDVFLGYNYFRKTTISAENLVKFLEDYADEDEFKALFDKHSNSPLTHQNNAALWEILIGRTQIKWKRGQYLYPVIIKYHHSLADGISLVAMITTNLLKDGVKNMKEKCDKYKVLLQKNKDKNKMAGSLRGKIVETCKKMWNKDFYIKFVGLSKNEEVNILHGTPLSGEKYLCYALESENSGYVDKVKGIKNRLSGVRFTDVVLTAVSASFAEYFMKNDENPPNTIRTAMTYYIASSDFNKIINMKDDHPVAKLQNNFSIGMVDIPIRDEDVEGNLLKRLKDVHNESESLRNSLDLMFMYWKIKIAGFLPRNLATPSIKNNDSTIILSNIPGQSTSTLLNGHVIRDVLLFSPNFVYQGVTFSIFTYDNLFRFALMVDKSLIHNRNEVQSIADNVFKYIDLLDNVTLVKETIITLSE